MMRLVQQQLRNLQRRPPSAKLQTLGSISVPVKIAIFKVLATTVIGGGAYSYYVGSQEHKSHQINLKNILRLPLIRDENKLA